MNVHLKHRPILDPEFLPAALWNRSYRACVDSKKDSRPLGIALERNDGSSSVFKTRVLAPDSSNLALNKKYFDRLLKFLLWQRGGCRVNIGGDPEFAAMAAETYRPAGDRAFDHGFMGEKVHGHSMTIENCRYDDLPEANANPIPLGRNFDGCRIGFDLGGSDRKCAALIDGKVVFSEEVTWDPYFQNDPQYHFDGINDSLQRAAAKLPRVDAIGGSAAGIYVNNEVRVASLFRGVPQDAFEQRVRGIFGELKKAWGGVPFEVVNDGEVTALAGAISLNDHSVLGVAMGTSQASGYVDSNGHLLPWLNELAFAPVDYRENAPADEWSGDIGCGAQYFSQQAVARLASIAGITFPANTPPGEQLIQVQNLMKKDDERARSIYETIGVCFGYSVAHYSEFYELKNLLVLGRVTSGEGGNIILEKAMSVMRDEFPELAGRIKIGTPNEQDKRHGQAIAAASLPKLH